MYGSSRSLFLNVIISAGIGERRNKPTISPLLPSRSPLDHSWALWPLSSFALRNNPARGRINRLHLRSPFSHLEDTSRSVDEYAYKRESRQSAHAQARLSHVAIPGRVRGTCSRSNVDVAPGASAGREGRRERKREEEEVRGEERRDASAFSTHVARLTLSRLRRQWLVSTSLLVL